MKPGSWYLYAQAVILLVYIAMGFLLLLHPRFADRFDPTLRIGLGVVLLAYAGFRAFALYRKFRDADDRYP